MCEVMLYKWFFIQMFIYKYMNLYYFSPQLFETKLDACSLLSELGLRYYCFVGICVHVVIMDYIMFARL